MTNDLLTKATALLEARQQATPGQWCGRLLIEMTEEDSDFCDIAANTACETIQGYQDLVRRMADAIERLIAGNLDMDELGEAKLLLDEARAALPHTATNV